MATVKTQLINLILEKFPTNQFRYTDIIITLVEGIRGEVYTSKNHRGYFATNLRNGYSTWISAGYLRKPSKKEPRFFDKVNGVWTVMGL